MKRNLFLLLNILFYLNNTFSQAPEIEWQKSLGGSMDDFGNLQKTIDGGYISSSASFSNDGDVSGHHGSSLYSDVWVIKLDSAFNIEWQKSYGGTLSDWPAGIRQNAEGNFYVFAQSSSIDGDVPVNYGEGDYWIFKINSIGDILWSKVYGGSSNDAARNIQITSDGGCLLVGDSRSYDGDVTGLHGLGGSSDCWIVKLDTEGNMEWEKCFGGSSAELGLSAYVDTDGYVIAGPAFSNDGDVSGNNGLYDFWIFKLSFDGILIWQNCYGGTKYDYCFSVNGTADSGYILTGYSESNNGDVSGHHGASAKIDAWVIKVDHTGNLEWQQSYGGTKDEYGKRIKQTLDGGYILTGSATSIDGDVSINKGGDDCWLLKLNSSGIIEWETTYGGSADETGGSILELPEGDWLIANHTLSNDEDVLFNHGGEDFWIVRFGEACTPTPELCNSLDDNCNGLIDDAITETVSISAGGPITFCQGGNVLLTATYSGATVQWKKNGTNIPGATSPTYLVNSKGTYTCETTSPCDTELSTGIFVNVQKNPPASITAGGATTFCAGGSVVLTANAGGGLSYQWYKGESLIAGATSINYTATIAGNYKCRVTKTAAGCFKNSNVINVSVPCKEGEIYNEEDAFSIYPNPNDGTFTIEANVKTQDFVSQVSTIEIFNNLGQLIFFKDVISNNGIINETIELDKIIPGMYLVKLNSDLRLSKIIVIK